MYSHALMFLFYNLIGHYVNAEWVHIMSTKTLATSCTLENIFVSMIMSNQNYLSTYWNPLYTAFFILPSAVRKQKGLVTSTLFLILSSLCGYTMTSHFQHICPPLANVWLLFHSFLHPGQQKWPNILFWPWLTAEPLVWKERYFETFVKKCVLSSS